MKKFLVSVFFLLSAGSANAVLPCPTTLADYGCNGEVAVDSGSGFWCREKLSCSCQGVYAPYPTAVGSSCPLGYTFVEGTVGGKRCCVSYGLPSVAEEKAMVEGEQELAKIFSPSATTVTDPFFGRYGTTLRSPTAGRINSSVARLDVCIGYADVDAAIATNSVSTCYNTYCGLSKNEYCNANSAEVCKDRCDCAILGESSSSCNWL
jgi:hypothetical protein